MTTSTYRAADPSVEPFLDKGNHNYWSVDESTIQSPDEDKSIPRVVRKRERWRCLFGAVPMVVVHLLILLSYTLIYVFLVRGSLQATRPLVYSPAAGAIGYVTKTVDGLQSDSVFAGRPNPESDAAWHDLMHGINLRLTPDEMQRLDQTSLELVDGSGYLGTLGVYHELHCIKRIRKWFYKDYYYPNSTELDELEHETHAAHCIELLRQAAICKGDISITSFKWLRVLDSREPTTKEGTLHQCVDWDRLSGWARERAVNLFDPNLLVPPSD